MKTKYKEGDIIIYPLPGVCIGQCYENIVPKEARILKVYDGICEDGVIVDFELLDNSIMGKITGKLLNEKNYLI